jgi:hypothetical protein
LVVVSGIIMALTARYVLHNESLTTSKKSETADASLLSRLWDFLEGLGEGFVSLLGDVVVREIAWFITSCDDVNRSSTDFFLERRTKTEVCVILSSSSTKKSFAHEKKVAQLTFCLEQYDHVSHELSFIIASYHSWTCIQLNLNIHST